MYHITSLPLRDAVRTRVLSHRWRHLQPHLPKLNFDADNVLAPRTLQQLREKFHLPLKSLRNPETDLFLRSVETVLKQQQGARVDELRVGFFLHQIHHSHLDALVRFAVASKTKKLGLRLEPPFLNLYGSCVFEDKYEFPFNLLGASSIEELSLVFCSVKPSCKFHDLHRLKKLVLSAVHVYDEDINRLVSSCSTLEILEVLEVGGLVMLRFPHSLKQLNRVTIKHCDGLRRIENNATNLSSMFYVGHPVQFIFEQSSYLKAAEIILTRAHLQHNLDMYLTEISRNMAHLRSLALSVFYLSEVKDLQKSSNTFINLRHFDLEWRPCGPMSLLHLATILDAAPVLEELKLCLSHNGDIQKSSQNLRHLREKIIEHPHTYLKTIEITNFDWDKWQVEIVLYVLKNACQLGLITLHKSGNIHIQFKQRDIMNLRWDIMELSIEVPSNVKLVIL